MSNSRQDKEFAELVDESVNVTTSIDGSNALAMAMDFIASNFGPEDVFSKKDLEEWAESNGFTKE
jgi:hypothetical protein